MSRICYPDGVLADCTTYVFDLDGTLVTTDLDFAAMKGAVVRLAAEAGVPTKPLESLDILAAVEHVCQRLDGAAEGFRARADAALAAWEVDGARRVHELGGSIWALDNLRQRGYRIGIVTRNCRPAVRISLARVPVPHDVLLTRDDVLHAKPHPEHLSRMLEALNAAPGSSVMVGDHWMDVRAGRIAGMRTIGILGSHGPERFRKEPPDLLLPDVAALIACLDAANALDTPCESVC